MAQGGDDGGGKTGGKVSSYTQQMEVRVLGSPASCSQHVFRDLCSQVGLHVGNTLYPCVHMPVCMLFKNLDT